jgi:hypothetical protein
LSRLFAETGEPDSIYETMRTADRPEMIALRTRLEEMWERFEPYADPHFLVEFRKHVNARYWEMYLGCAFMTCGYEVNSCDTGPDLLLTHAGKRIWVEAVEATSGAEDSPDRCPEFPSGAAFDFPEEQMLLRYRNAIEKKRLIREQYVAAGVVEPEDAYIVAVNAGSIPYSFVSEDPPRILSAVYPVGAPQIHIRIEDGVTLSVDNVYRPAVAKANGSEVRTDIFLDEAYGGISAVVYSGANAWNMPAEVGSDLVIVHNLPAASPIPLEWWPFGEQWVARRESHSLIFEKARARSTAEAWAPSGGRLCTS